MDHIHRYTFPYTCLYVFFVFISDKGINKLAVGYLYGSYAFAERMALWKKLYEFIQRSIISQSLSSCFAIARESFPSADVVQLQFLYLQLKIR